MRLTIEDLQYVICEVANRVVNENAKEHIIYCYEDEETNAIYVGLTCNPTRRDWEHRNGYYYRGNKLPSTVCKYFTSINKEIPKPTILKTDLTPSEAQFWEGELVERFKRSGKYIINIAKTGSLGGTKGIRWTVDSIKEFIETYNMETPEMPIKNPRSLMLVNPSASARMYYKNWTDEIFPNRSKRKPKGYWDSIRVIQNYIEEYNADSTNIKNDVKFINCPEDLAKVEKGAYNKMCSNNWQKILFPNMREYVPNGYWDILDNIKKFVYDYNANPENKEKIVRPTQLISIKKTVYDKMAEHGWQYEVFPELKKRFPRGWWDNLENIQNAIQEFNNNPENGKKITTIKDISVNIGKGIHDALRRHPEWKTMLFNK